MKVYRRLEEFTPLTHAVVTQGTFDGVHLGHQKILNHLKNLAAEKQAETVLLTFFPHPRLVINPDDESLKLLETFEEKIQHLENIGIDHLLIIPFTKALSGYSAERFIQEILVDRIGTKTLVVGYDHRFGHNREGNFELLATQGALLGFTVQEIPAQDLDEVTISSTKIRKALLAGDLRTANQYLGYHYKLNGEVKEGYKQGRQLGFPTANLFIADPFKLIPADGVYAVRVKVGHQSYPAMANIGMQPTFASRKHNIEAHLFNFNQNLYGQHIEIEFVDKIRDELRFSDTEALRKQLEMDKFEALNLLQ